MDHRQLSLIMQEQLQSESDIFALSQHFLEYIVDLHRDPVISYDDMMNYFFRFNEQVITRLEQANVHQGTLPIFLACLELSVPFWIIHNRMAGYLLGREIRNEPIRQRQRERLEQVKEQLEFVQAIGHETANQLRSIDKNTKWTKKQVDGLIKMYHALHLVLDNQNYEDFNGPLAWAKPFFQWLNQKSKRLKY